MDDKKIQRCCLCDEPTGRCEEDAIYFDNGVGPLCADCYDAGTETDTKEGRSNG